MNKFYIRIILPTIFTIVLFILAIFLIIIPHFQQNIMNGKREMIKELTNSAWSILAKYEADERSGALSREEAQKTAVSRIQYLRYGDENKDYFWITDMHPVMIVHPYRPDLNGKDLSDLSDPHGKKLFVEFVNTVKKADHGYVDYMWQWKDDSMHIVPKLSYVRIFKPWDWVIGTGIYLEDVKKEITALTRKLIWISIGISLIIALLLLFINQQSLAIEHQRRQAEKELHESKEKYRTLVEASTEGLVMMIDGRIGFSNRIISNITGIEPDELAEMAFQELLSPSNSNDIFEAFSGPLISEGLFEIRLKKNNGGFAEVLATCSKALLYNKSVTIIIIKDITIDKKSDPSDFDFQRLIGTLNIGYLRIKIDTRGKIIFANDTAIRLLGCSNAAETAELNFLELPAGSDERKRLREMLLTNGFVKNLPLSIYKKNNGKAILSATLVTLHGSSGDDITCDGFVEDISVLEQEKEAVKGLISNLRAESFLLEQPVSSFLTPARTMDADQPISEAIRIINIYKAECLLLTKNGKDCIGIITGSDIRNRLLSLNLHTDNPSYLIMSSPVVYISEQATVKEALDLFDRKKIHHLVTGNIDNGASGILHSVTLNTALKNSLSFLTWQVAKAETTEEIKVICHNMQLFIRPVIASGISVNYITAVTSAFSDAIIGRLADLAIREYGPPPVPFSFICMGSEGRKEETLFTDQDNAIIYDNVAPDMEKPAAAYFLKVGNRICTDLNDAGYSFCKGNVMAMNPKWCQPLLRWEKYFTEWIQTPEPKNLLDATIFFDLRHVYGDETITIKTSDAISRQVALNPIFIYHMAYNTCNTKLPQIITGNDKTSETLDLKHAVTLIVMFARTYALQQNISATGTIERLQTLNRIKVISDSTCREMIFSYNYLMKHRFENQAAQAEQNLSLSNILNIKRLIDIDLNMLKKVLSLIPLYQGKISSDFRING